METNTKDTILIVEDEKDLAELLSFNLENAGYQTFVALDGPSGLQMAQKSLPNLILLDLMLPGMSGIDICKVLKGNKQTAHIAIVLLTAKGEEIDRVVGFEIGADDYVVKPFSFRELLLRIKVLLRRTSPTEPAATAEFFRVGPITIDTIRHLVTIDDIEVFLTATEYKLLLILAQRLGRVQSRELLLKDVWGYNYSGDTRTVDTHITRLRNKIGDAGAMIKTVRGFGYRMETA